MIMPHISLMKKIKQKTEKQRFGIYKHVIRDCNSSSTCLMVTLPDNVPQAFTCHCVQPLAPIPICTDADPKWFLKAKWCTADGNREEMTMALSWTGFLSLDEGYKPLFSSSHCKIHSVVLSFTAVSQQPQLLAFR